MSRLSGAAADTDLQALEVPAGLDEGAFDAVVRSRMIQSPVVERVDELLAESQRFGAVRDVLADTLNLDREEADHAWQTLMRWLLHFMPERYDRRVPSYSEVLTRRRPSRAST